MILTIIQARLGSTRLRGKIHLPIAGKSILKHVYDAALEPKVVAVPQEDYPEITGVNGLNLPIIFYPHDGDVNDVLGRFYHAWKDYKPEADWIFRLTADCPMLTREIIARFLAKINELDLPKMIFYNTIFTNRPCDPDGYDMELFTARSLNMAHEYAIDPYDREHVTPWLYRHLNVCRFSVMGRMMGVENPEEKCSVDTLEDYEKVKKLMETAQ